MRRAGRGLPLVLTLRSRHGALVLAATAGLLMAAVSAPAQEAPPIEDFAALASTDDAIAAAAAARLRARWRDGYAPLVVDLARFFPSARGAQAARIRARLMGFLAGQTKQELGDDLRAWRKWMWARPYDPHPDYATFKARLYARVDPRLADFFAGAVRPRIRLDEIDWGGVGVNGIPPLDHPRVVPAARATFMGDANVVFGIVVGGEARAYPKRILAWHEMALDVVGGVPLAVVYCTLCGTVIPYESTLGGRAFTFGTSGLLYRSNKLMFDAETHSLWSTLEGRPVVGPLAQGALVLKYRPVVTTTWKEWRTEHPETTVLALDTGHQRDYGEGVAYRDYFARDELMFEVPEEDARLRRKDEVLTFFAGGESRPLPVAIDVALLRRRPLFSFTAADVPYLVLTSEAGANRVYRSDGVRFVGRSGGRVDDERGRHWIVTEDRLLGPGGAVLLREPARRAFWFAWRAQFPATLLIKE